MKQTSNTARPKAISLSGVECRPFSLFRMNSYAPVDYKAMREIANRLGNEWMGGAVVYEGNVLKKIAEPNIWAVPSRRLFI